MAFELWESNKKGSNVAKVHHRVKISVSDQWTTAEQVQAVEYRESSHWLKGRAHHINDYQDGGAGVEVSTRRNVTWPSRPVCATAGRRHAVTFCGVWGSPGPGHRLANIALLSLVHEPGTDYCQPSDCQNCRYLHSSASSRPTWLFQHYSAGCSCVPSTKSRLNSTQLNSSSAQFSTAQIDEMTWNEMKAFLNIACSDTRLASWINLDV